MQQAIRYNEIWGIIAKWVIWHRQFLFFTLLLESFFIQKSFDFHYLDLINAN